VKKPNGTDSMNHSQDQLLPFLEDRLSSEDRAMVQEHINSCKECSHEVQMLGDLMGKLKANKDVFCPEPHRLFDFTETGEDPEGKLARHIEQCPLCQENVAAYRAGCEVRVLPEKVHAAYRNRFSQAAPRQLDVSRRSLFADLTDWLSSFFKLPAFALATAAAAILVVVLIYPRGEIEPYLGLSSVTWKQADDDFAPKSIYAEPKKPRVAVLIYFKGFKKPWDQAKIDALYEALAPVVEAQESITILSPAEIQAALKEKGHLSSLEELFEFLGKDLNVSSAVILEVLSGSDGFRIDGRVIDAASGETIHRQSPESLPEDQLPSKLGETFTELLKAKPPVH